MSNQSKHLVLKNVVVKYAKVIRPGMAFDDSQPPQWSVNMYVTDEDHRALMAEGAEAKKDKNGSPFYLAKRSTRNKKGEEVAPPAVVDGRKQPFDKEVGNGSVCNIAVTLFPWSKGARSGVLVYLNAVQVVNHVPFVSAGDAFDMIDTGDASGEKDDLPFD